MSAFFGRKKETEQIRTVLSKPSAAVMVYGKRKVGKTTLILHALQENPDTTVYYECIRSSLQDNVNGFVQQLVRQGVLPVAIRFGSFPDVFYYLDTLGRELNIVIDEYPYLKALENAETVDSQFQTIIDHHIGHIRLILSGSHIRMMKDMLSEKNALYGRFTLTLCLKEMDYLEAASFYPEKAVYDKVSFYAVFGGSPFINSFIDPSESLKENVIRTLLNPASPVYGYAEHLLISDYANTVNAERILSAIANGKKKYSEIETMLGMKNNGLLSKQLAALLDMEIIAKVYPINRPDDKKKVSYELCDNVLRMYYAYIYLHKSALQLIGAEAFYYSYIEPSIDTFISHRFEEISRNYFSLCAKCGRLDQVKNIGTYWYDDAAAHTNGEFDVVVERQGSYDIYEAKYYRNPLPVQLLHREAEKIRNLKGLNVGSIGFISANGYEMTDTAFELIDGEMLYDPSLHP